MCILYFNSGDCEISYQLNDKLQLMHAMAISHTGRHAVKSMMGAQRHEESA